jgi:hypothetical protein
MVKIFEKLGFKLQRSREDDLIFVQKVMMPATV